MYDCISEIIFFSIYLFQAVSAIRLSHEEVINELLRLAREEANWRVKAHCVKGDFLLQSTGLVQVLGLLDKC